MRRTVMTAAIILLVVTCATSNQTSSVTLDDVFRRPETVPGFWQRYRVAVTIRSTSPDGLEWQITLMESGDGVSAEVTEAVREPISQQLERVRSLAGLQVLRYEIKNVDSLRALLERFGELRVPLVPPQAVYLHPATLTVWTSTASSTTEFYLALPPDHPTARWGSGEVGQAELINWSTVVRKTVSELRSARPSMDLLRK